MLLVLNVHFYRNAPAAPLFGRFSESGGTIGRSPGNVLVLDDPGKYISRTHALVTFRSGQFFLADMGSNPSVVNDRPLGKGREVALAAGDRITVGDYLMEAQIDKLAASADGAADPLGFSTLGMSPSTSAAYVPLFEPPPAPTPVVLPPFDGFGLPVATPAILPPMSTRDVLAGASILDSALPGGFGSQADPLGLNLLGAALVAQGGVPGSAVGDPLGVGFRGSVYDHAAPERFAMPMPTLPPMPAPPVAAPWAGGGIPDDYDPMADFLPRASAPAVPVAPQSPTTPPSMASTAPAAPELQLPDDFDPLAAMFEPGSPTPTDIVASMPPHAAVTPDANPLAAAVAHPGGTSSPVHGSAPHATTVPAPMPPPDFTARIDAESVAGRGLAVLSERAGPRAAGSLPPQAFAGAAPAACASDTAAHDGTLAALLHGLGLPDLQTKLAGPELAELVGAMLREATRGAMQTLMARSVTKRESRVEMTMIASQANNPLKFFPDAADALNQMLAQKGGGYMKPVRAFGNAFEDLQAHEMAVMAGMRAALAAVLKRFDPEAVEQRLDVPTVLDKMMASSRKAKMWDQLVALYAEISREADDDFQRLFGESFATAYEEQVDRMHGRDK